MEVKMVNKSLDNGPIESNAHVAIAFDVLQSEKHLSNLAETVKSGGFVLTSESGGVPESAIDKSNLVLISKLSADGRTFYLLRKVRRFDRPSSFRNVFTKYVHSSLAA